MTCWHRKPYATTSGEQRFSVGYTDETGRSRTRGGFRARKGKAGCDQWIAQYRVAEAQGLSALARFLNDAVRGPGPNRGQEPLLDEVMARWLYESRPESNDGLATSTYISYLQTYRKHIRPLLGDRPISDFERAAPAVELRGHLTAAGIGNPTITRSRAVLSSCVAWAAENEIIAANGVRLMTPRKRRSTRYINEPQRRRQRDDQSGQEAAKALTPGAAASVVYELRTAPRSTERVRRLDSTMSEFQYLTGCRNQDRYGLRWGDVADGTIEFVEVVSSGRLNSGKVRASDRTVPTNPRLELSLSDWRVFLKGEGIPVEWDDFIFPGSAPEGHQSEAQIKRWGNKRFKPACRRVAAREPRLARLGDATPYSLRRGHISMRLRGGEDEALVARQCGTSIQMLRNHYQREIEAGEIGLGTLHEQFAQAYSVVLADAAASSGAT